MFPGFFLAFLYVLYVLGWALLNPKVAPPLQEELTRVPVPAWLSKLQHAYSHNMLVTLIKALILPNKALAIEAEGIRISYGRLLANFAAALVPLALAAVTLWVVWWYVVIHQQASAEQIAAQSMIQETITGAKAPPGAPVADEGLEELGSSANRSAQTQSAEPEELEQIGSPELLQGAKTPSELGPPKDFYFWFFICTAGILLVIGYYYWKLGADQFEILKLLVSSVMPLGILTVIVLAVILFGITTATESAAVGAAGAFLLALQAGTLNWQRVKESVFLTAKTTAMVCWLFVGSALFSAVFAILGGQQLVEHWVLSLNLTPIHFMLLSQAIIFLLGWPLEWTEIIVIFVPIFLPLLKHFDIDPVLWGTIVFVNLQAAFLSPPVAMSAFYLKGVSPPHVTLNQIFAGMMPYMLIVILCMVIMYVWPGMTLWLPNYLYGR
jgi:TRAP-type mannitol/chloroaromatic compound transport system permease large subunit